MFTCSSPYGPPGSSSSSHHQRLSASSLEDQSPSFSSEFCSPPSVNQSFNAFLPSSDVPSHHAMSLSSFDNNNDISCHGLKMEPTVDLASYQQQQQQQQQQLLQQPQQQQVLLGLQQPSHHSNSLLMQSPLSGNIGSVIPPISSLHCHLPLHHTTNHPNSTNVSSSGDSNGLLTSILLPASSSAINTTSTNVMDMMAPSSTSGHMQNQHLSSGAALNNGGLMDSRHSSSLGGLSNSSSGGRSSTNSAPSYHLAAAAAAAAATAAALTCAPSAGDSRTGPGSLQPVDLTHQQHHHAQHHQLQHPQQQHPHQQHHQQHLMMPAVVMAPQQHTTSVSTPTSLTITSYAQHQPQPQHQQSNLNLTSPIGPMASEWGFLDSTSRSLTSTATTSCASSDMHIPPLPLPMDTSRSFMSSAASGAGGFGPSANGCGGARTEDLRARDRSGSARGQVGQQQQQQQQPRCNEEPMLTNLETWKVVTGEPVEMETNNNVGPGEDANCLGVVSTTTSAVSTVSACVTNAHGVVHHGPPILSRQGSVDELITHCLSSETENMLTDPDLWQILSSEGTMDHAPSLEEAESIKVKRSLSSDQICAQNQCLVPASNSQPPSCLSPTGTPPSLLPSASVASSTPSQNGSDPYTPSPASSLRSLAGGAGLDGPLGCGGPGSTPGSIITSHFWKYNAQSKGPKARRMDLRDPGYSKDETCGTSKGNPYRLVEFRDPVQDRNDLIHCTKIRKGDGNDITPNPLKLHKMGIELNRLNGLIQAVVSNTEGDRVKKEKNRIASQSCRLKRKAYNEANKIKLCGLGLEHRELLDVLSRIKRELGRRVAYVEARRRQGGEENRDPAGARRSPDHVPIILSDLIRKARREINKTRVSGRSDLYVGEVLEEVWRQENAAANAAAAAAASAGSVPGGPVPSDLPLIRPPD